MKTCILLLWVSFWISQEISAQDMVIVRKSGTSEAVRILDIDSIYFTESQPLVYDSIMDIDSNVYRTVVIGTQKWMADNLKTKHFRNGDTIPTTPNAFTDISFETNPEYFWSYEGDENNEETYGLLYTWYVVDDSAGLCPSGWHVSTDEEWTALSVYLGGTDIAGGSLKEAGFAHWVDPNYNATNVSGFSALPGGGRDVNGIYYFIGYDGGWWTGSEENEESGWSRGLGYDAEFVNRASGINKKLGFSVRCVED